MFLRRLFRYLVCLVIAVPAVAFVLPYAGVNPAHYLPPTWVYAKAAGQTSGAISYKYSVQTNDPFQVGKRLYFWDYTFYVKQLDPVKNKPVLTPVFGEVRVDKDYFDAVNVGRTVLVRYEKTYPWINGLDSPAVGLGCGPGSNILSGWLIWVGVAALAAFVLMSIVEHFLLREDI